MFRRDGDVITVTMSREQYDLLTLCLGMALATVFLQEGPAAGIKIVQLMNELNEGNPDFEPYVISRQGH